MARTVRFEHSSAGYLEVMKSGGVEQDLQRRADRVKGAAEPQYSGEDTHGTTPVEVIADTYVGKARSGATVIAIHPRSLAIEMERRILGGAIDAAGG